MSPSLLIFSSWSQLLIAGYIRKLIFFSIIRLKRAVLSINAKNRENREGCKNLGRLWEGVESSVALFCHGIVMRAGE